MMILMLFPVQEWCWLLVMGKSCLKTRLMQGWRLRSAAINFPSGTRFIRAKETRSNTYGKGACRKEIDQLIPSSSPTSTLSNHNLKFKFIDLISIEFYFYHIASIFELNGKTYCSSYDVKHLQERRMGSHILCTVKKSCLDSQFYESDN